ncbi:hypothetical protein E6Q11_04200 [Candidatus Dojkabacteria bacterium]|uniref:DUF4134 domain-containing protein n=1 Tax=Candidatus Dojkabacteria bacterium TaxID=2099670 RepID=A0A5C7J5D4_9BACT|nr:MAG: hypothetical protein E6Q11_04200 [Candidatus Dojkabacteria bacterium]
MRTKYKINIRNAKKLLVTAAVLSMMLAPGVTPLVSSVIVHAEEPATVDTGGNLNESLPGGTRKNDCQQGSSSLNAENCGIVKWLQTFINILSAAAGLVITIVIIVGGIQYSAAKDDPQAVAAAKSRITNAIIALAAFIFFYAFLQWVVPGGVL